MAIARRSLVKLLFWTSEAETKWSPKRPPTDERAGQLRLWSDHFLIAGHNPTHRLPINF